ncbi:MAG: GUN4 domain-containing protein [Cyanobacteria bacterium P01_C01_bin.89]
MAVGKKFALLVGVGDYAEDSGIEPLSTPVENVKALAAVLEDEAVGGFDEVTMLPNPTLGEMAQSVSALVYGRAPDDLLLLYFSGHGLTDETGRLYFSNCATRKYPNGTLDKGTAMGAATLKDLLSSPIHRRVVIVLDCCFAGAFGEGVLTMDDGRIELEAALGGQGRVVLAAADSRGYALEESGKELSVYTRYVHEGLKTGAAAKEGSEWISVRMLHDYVVRRVRQGGYAMRPQIFVEQDGCGIYVARAKVGDPELRYRRECEKYFDEERGEFPQSALLYLGRRAAGLSIVAERAAELREAVRRPWVEYRENLAAYREALAADLEDYGATLPDVVRAALGALRQELSLKDKDVTEIEVELMAAVLPEAEPEAVAQPNEEDPQPETEPMEVSYQKLEELLAAGDWRAADEETYQLMRKAAKPEQFTGAVIADVPCEDLLTINRLWIQYSEGKWGFGIQDKIWKECGSPMSNDVTWERFGNRIGWRKSDKWLDREELNFNLETSPNGHLPWCMWSGVTCHHCLESGGGVEWDQNFSTLSNKLRDCDIQKLMAELFQ